MEMLKTGFRDADAAVEGLRSIAERKKNEMLSLSLTCTLDLLMLLLRYLLFLRVYIYIYVSAHYSLGYRIMHTLARYQRTRICQWICGDGTSTLSHRSAEQLSLPPHLVVAYPGCKRLDLVYVDKYMDACTNCPCRRNKRANARCTHRDGTLVVCGLTASTRLHSGSSVVALLDTRDRMVWSCCCYWPLLVAAIVATNWRKGTREIVVFLLAICFSLLFSGGGGASILIWMVFESVETSSGVEVWAGRFEFFVGEVFL